VAQAAQKKGKARKKIEERNNTRIGGNVGKNFGAPQTMGAKWPLGD